MRSLTNPSSGPAVEGIIQTNVEDGCLLGAKIIA
jgi:hypothetical protein